MEKEWTYEDAIEMAKEIIENFPNRTVDFSQPGAQELYLRLSRHATYYRGSEQIVLLADSEKLEMVEKFKKFLENFNYQPICVFSADKYNELWNSSQDLKAIPERQFCYVVLASSDEKWKNIDYDLKLGEFDEDSFHTILDFLE